MFSKSLYRPSGHLITTPLDGGPDIVQDTYQCGHCGRHWVWEEGSKRLRGHCMLCNKPTCGPSCMMGERCVEQERYCENVESGKPADHRPIIVSVPARVTAGGIMEVDYGGYDQDQVSPPDPAGGQHHPERHAAD